MPDTPTLHQLAMLRFNPEPIVVHKPRPDGKGVALKLDLRITPDFDAEKGYVKDADGGVFLELAPQVGKTEDGKFPTFGWKDERLIGAKLGLADLTNILTAIERVRKGSWVPAANRPKSPPKGELESFTPEQRHARTLSLFHKFGTSSTAISWEFLPSPDNPRSMLSVSKSAEKRSSIALTLAEERLIERYLSNALDAFIAVGLR